MLTHSASVPVEAIERQRRWEMESVNRGITRYQETIAAADTADTDAGRRMLVDIIANVSPAIEAAQEEALAGMARLSGRWSEWWLPILCLEANKQAFIAARSAINAPLDIGATSIAVDIAKMVKLQREFELWKESEYRKERDRDLEGTPEVVNLYKLMSSRVKKIDARTARKWMAKTENLDRLDWELTTKVAFGAKLIDLLVTHGGGYFELGLMSEGMDRFHKTTRVLRLTPEAERFMQDINETSELNRPFLMPMLVPPVPWAPVI